MQLPFKAISAFQSTARLGSLTKAAAELGVTPSAVSQQIAFLESFLGAALISKLGRGIRLTEAGERYYDMIADEIDRIGDATNRMRGYKSMTALTIRAAPTFASRWLLPRLPQFLDAHPNLEVLIDANAEPFDFARETVDLEIRHGEGRWSGLFVESLVEETVTPLCSPQLAAARSIAAQDLLRFRLIHSVRNLVQWGSWLRLAGVREPKRWQRMLFSRSHMSIDAAINGAGIALESEFTTSREREAGLLVCPVIDPPEVRIRSLWMVCPFERVRQAKVAMFMGWLKAQLAAK